RMTPHPAKTIVKPACNSHAHSAVTANVRLRCALFPHQNICNAEDGHLSRLKLEMNWSLVRVYLVVEDSPNHITEGHRQKANSPLHLFFRQSQSCCSINIRDGRTIGITDR